MKQWIITFSKDENTTKLELNAERQPSMDETIAFVTAYAEKNYEVLEGSTPDKGLEGPAQDLLKRFGIAITGIVEHH